MSETRALSDKLKEVREELRQTREQLDKQRAHHAREQAALRKTLEETRREATRLRARVEKEEERRQAQAAAVAVVSTEPPWVESPGTVPHMIVALARLPPSEEEALPALSRLVQLSPVDVRMRLRLPLPAVLARLPTLEAELLRDLLIAEGFSVVLGEVSRMAQGLMQVRRFTLEEQALSLETMRRERHQVRYSELALVVRGRRKTTKIETQEAVTYNLLSRTREIKEVTLRHEHLENFLWVYGGGTAAAITEETSLAGLGALRSTTRFATLQLMMDELRRRAPRAVVDERFLRTMRLSLPLVPPERSQEVLAGLTYEAIKEGMWP